MRTRKLRFVSAILALAMLLAMVPVGAWADSDTTSSDDLVEVPAGELVISDGVCTGIKEDWLNTHSNAHLKITIPDTVTSIADSIFSSQHYNFGARVYAVDFSNAYNLTQIGNQSFYGQSNLSGVLDLSATRITTIKGGAFRDCSSITGVILPTSLTVLGDSSAGSVFCDCSSLQYVRTDGKSATATFELPDNLTFIGRYTFQGAFANSIKINLPATVTTVGSQAFNSNKIEQVVVNYEGDFANYDTKAFVSNQLVVFKNKAAYDTFYTKAISTTQSALTYPIKLTYAGTNIKQDKLHNQSIQYEKDNTTGFWAKNSNYALPAIPDSASGFTAKWMLNGKELEPDSKISATNDVGDTAEAISFVEPKFVYTQNGEYAGEDATSHQFSVQLTKSKTQSVGIKATHPLLRSEQGTANEYVYFLYFWKDLKGWSDGPRTTEDSNLFGVWTQNSEIPITSLAHDRTGSGNEYRVTTYMGYKKGTDAVKFYDYGEKTIYVTVTQPDEYTISYDLNGGTAADGVSSYENQYVVYGESFTAKAAPKKDGYTFTGWSDGTKTYAADAEITPTGDMTLKAQWEEAPTSVEPDPEPAKTYPVVSDFGKLTDQKDGGSAVSNASKGQRIFISLPEDKQTQGDMKFTYWDVQPESLKDALIASGFDPYSTETSFLMPELADGQTLTINPHYEDAAQADNDDSFLMTAAAVAGGAALTGLVVWQGYNIFAETVLKADLPAGVAIPQNREELALLLWNEADRPAPAEDALYTDVDAEDADTQAAARWAVENGLLKPADKNGADVFKPYKSVSVGQVYRAWKKVQEMTAQ